MGFWDKMEREMLDRLSIDILNLPNSCLNTMRVHKFETLGDCIDYFAHGIVPHKAGLLYRILKPVMETELKPKLEEMAYWKYVEQELAE